MDSRRIRLPDGDSDKDGIEQQLHYIKSFDPKEIVIFGGEAAVSGRIEGYLAKAH